MVINDTKLLISMYIRRHASDQPASSLHVNMGHCTTASLTTEQVYQQDETGGSDTD